MTNLKMPKCAVYVCPSATFALQHGGFVPREWLAAKGLFSRCVFPTILEPGTGYQYGISDVILRGNQWWRLEMSVFSISCI